MIKKNMDLGKMTTMKIGGMAKELYIPESVDELKSIMCQIGSDDVHIISGGSNLLINDKKIFDRVISMRELDKRIINKGNGLFYVGASSRIQKVITETNTLGYGGLEQFYSIPALVGGMIYMNAGVGRKKNDAIGDYIVSVDVYENGKMGSMSREECLFGYRESAFQKKASTIILGATLQLKPTNIEEAKHRIKARMDYVKNSQDHSGANFGTLFCEADTRLIALTRFFRKGNPEGVHFSRKRPNCLINSGKGTYDEAIRLIRTTQIIHKIFYKTCKLEVRIWD